jgi:hypothetical protein
MFTRSSNEKDDTFVEKTSTNKKRNVTPSHSNDGANKHPRTNDESKCILNKENQDCGLLYCLDEAAQLYCFMEFIKQSHEMDKIDWGTISQILANKVLVDVRTVKHCQVGQERAMETGKNSKGKIGN